MPVSDQLQAAYQRIIDSSEVVDTHRLWTGCLNQGGYGVITFNNTSFKVHRLMWQFCCNNGDPIPEITADGHTSVIRHKCTFRHCCEPTHLELGSLSENAYDDRLRDGTLLIGEKSYRARISEETARKIKLSKYPKGHEKYMSAPTRAKLFETTHKTVSMIDQGNTWAHIPDREGKTHEAKNAYKRKRLREASKRAKERVWTKEDFEAAKSVFNQNTIDIVEFERETYDNEELNVVGPCHIWKKVHKGKRYGSVRLLGKTFGTHNLAAEIAAGRHQQKGENVRHLCGQPACCNPQHIRFGTNQENSWDALEHGSKRVKLTKDQIREIRESPLSTRKLGAQLGVGGTAVQKVRSGQRWKHIN
jgi:hypothetical protein